MRRVNDVNATTLVVGTQGEFIELHQLRLMRVARVSFATRLCAVCLVSLSHGDRNVVIQCSVV